VFGHQRSKVAKISIFASIILFLVIVVSTGLLDDGLRALGPVLDDLMHDMNLN
jgi:hypothetical protein